MLLRTVALSCLLLGPLVAQDTFNGKTARAWMEQMHDSSPDERDKAQDALQIMADRAHVVVLEALQDADKDVQLRTLQLAARLGRRFTEGVDTLRAIAKDADPAIQVAAKAALLRVTARREELAKITAELASKDAPMVIAAAQALAELGADAAPAIPDLVAVLGKQGEFYEAVKVIEVPRARTQALGVHLEVVRAIHTLHAVAGSAVPALARALQHSSTWVRDAAIKALGAMGAAALPAVPQLIAHLDNPDWGERRDVAIALGEIAAAAPGTQDDAVQALIGLLADDVGYVRGATCNALVRLGPEAGAAVPALVKLLGDSDRRNQSAREHAIDALGAIGPAAKAATPLLEELVTGEDRLAPAAVRALAGVAPETGKRLPAVGKRLEEIEAGKLPYEVRRSQQIEKNLAVLAGKDEEAKTSAVVELGQMFARESEAALLALLDKHPAPRLGTAIVGVLGDLGARSAAEKIRPLLDDVALRDAAAFTLARFGDAATMPRLLAMFGKDPGREVALAIVFGANGVEEAAPIFARTIAPIDGAPSDPTSFLRLARLLMRDPSFAAPLRANLDVLEKSKDVSADDRIAQRAEILQELASVDPVGQRDLLLAHLQDKEPSELQATLAAGLARAQEPRAFPILIAADTLADLGWYSSPQLMQRLDGLWLEAAEWEHVPMRVVAKSIATRLSIEIVFAPAVTAAQQREPIDMGEVYEFLPRGLRMRALAWLDMLGRHPFPGTGGARDASSALGWLPEDGKVRIVPRSEAAAFWRAEAERREKRPAKEPSSGK